LIGILIESTFLLFFPFVVVLSYLYLAGLKATVEGLKKGPRLAVLTGITLLWLATVPGPIAFAGALAITIAFVVLAFFENIVKGIIALLKLLNPKRFWEGLLEGCGSEEGCAARYLAAWPALAAAAATTQLITGPLTMFVLGMISRPPKLSGRLSHLSGLVGLAVVLIAWAFAVINVLKNLVLPQWLLTQEYAISGEVSKLPLTARLLASVLGREAAYAYVALLIALAVYTASRVHSALKPETRREVVAAIAPFVAYSVSMNKLGEPLTSVAYALGLTVAYSMHKRGLEVPGGLSEAVLRAFARIGKGILDYAVPLGPLRRLLS